MAIIKKNPHLPDYFVEVPGVSSNTPLNQIKSIIPLYEDAKVIYFPDLKPDTDFDFWASLDTDTHPELKKLASSPSVQHDTEADAAEQMKRLLKVGISHDVATRVCKEMSKVLESILPIYRKLFEGYKFVKGQVAWRLNEIHAENLHVDCYKEPLPNHFARMFVNLDNQPRIWHTSWRANEVIEIAKPRVKPEQYRELSTNDLWSAFNRSVFGKTSQEWWDDQQRHIAFFQPGDVWSVDSRLVAHQIFYGRRALSIDFQVDPASMLNPDLHYLKLAEKARAESLSA